MNTSGFKMKRELFEKKHHTAGLFYMLVCGLALGGWLAINVPL
jgi:hypothetical protein